MKLGCIVLAAGKSSRFGENKLLKELGGQSVILRVLRALPRSCFEKCVAVCASNAVEQRIRSCAMEAVRYGGGTLSDSIRAGLSAMPELDGWMFVNGDQPLLQSRSLFRMVEVFRENPNAVCRLSFGDTQASPVLFPAAMRDALMRLEGEQGGMCAAKRLRAKIIPVQADSAAELLDVDDEALFARVREYLNENPSLGEA